MLLYFDESGNTGSNWLDAQQPYFVYGGWLVKDDKKEFATNLLAECFADSKAIELKSKTIWDRKKDKLITFINRMVDDAEALPCFGIANKKYMIAAKIVETFFDYYYNPHVNSYLTHRSPLKKALADSLSKNDTIVEKFAKLVKEGTIGIGQMRVIKKEIEEHFRRISIPVFEVVNQLSDDNLVEMIDEFERITKNGAEKKWLSLVVPILFERISCLDYFCSISSEKGNIYVDQLSGFNDIFNEFNIILSNKGIYTNDIKISIRDSKLEPLIQAADLLSGFVSRSFIEFSKISLDNEINMLWRKLICLRDIFSEQGIVLWEFYGNETFINSIAELAAYPQPKINSPELVIEKCINKAIV